MIRYSCHQGIFEFSLFNHRTSNDRYFVTHRTSNDFYLHLMGQASSKNYYLLFTKTTPHITQNQAMDPCVLLTMTYGCQTSSPNKQLTN